MPAGCKDELEEELPAMVGSGHSYCGSRPGLSQHRGGPSLSPRPRYVTTKAAPIPLHHRVHRLLCAAESIASSGKKGVVVDGRGREDHEGYGEAFGQTDASKCPVAPAFDDHCFAVDADQHPAAADDDDVDTDNADRRGVATSASHHQHLHHQQQPHHQSPKRKDRDDASDGEPPYCYNSSLVANKKSRPMWSSGDNGKRREEWTDTAIGSLLDAYTAKYEQLNRGNLRGRDWEDVATTVSERCNKSVERCKNKIDNLKKQYKVECQRLNSSGVPTGHWPWFKKMEQIVGSSSSSLKAASDDDKSITVGGPAAVMTRIRSYPVAISGPVSINNNSEAMALIAKEIAIQTILVAVVIGGQNIFCGYTWIAATGIDRATTYQMGMMESLMNAIMLQASLEKLGVEVRIQSTLMMQEIAEPYIRHELSIILKNEESKYLVGLVQPQETHFLAQILQLPCGPLKTIDLYDLTTVRADAVLKGTAVDSIYNSHSRNSNGSAFEHVSFRELVSRGFTAMDMTAQNICEENSIPVVIFNLSEPGNVSKALYADQIVILIDRSGRII
ncbi:Alcohol dehydrogenase transcription factor Myb/SANT-like [Musa troglodytarum]|uniref:Alcohol dehydrogenase transcription factor Myb/SANT-like n=1 Tax=Musa troglodytarum TaxID=320322 RepID=A0A9E7HZ94_9LILI|nr:Alcohol dehydrogenase transcription factor Myb/SANT-like [Musa troglodytarum]